jgi:hypothetical protein
MQAQLAQMSRILQQLFQVTRQIRAVDCLPIVKN